MSSISTTKIPTGSERFYEAIERLKNASPNCTNRYELAQCCCKLCEKASTSICEDCYVQTVGDLEDDYRKEIQKKSKTGMYSSGFYETADGDFHYATPQGSG